MVQDLALWVGQQIQNVSDQKDASNSLAAVMRGNHWVYGRCAEMEIPLLYVLEDVALLS